MEGSSETVVNPPRGLGPTHIHRLRARRLERVLEPEDRAPLVHRAYCKDVEAAATRGGDDLDHATVPKEHAAQHLGEAGPEGLAVRGALRREGERGPVGGVRDGEP
jgi:hypothetical protein